MFLIANKKSKVLSLLGGGRLDISFTAAALLVVWILRREYIEHSTALPYADARNGANEGVLQKALSVIERSSVRKCNAGQRNFSEYRRFSKSQQGEDVFLWNYFGDMCGGSYIELGAIDGVVLSNSFIFNKALGWSGILVEASPVNAANLMNNRPDDICVNAAVCNITGVVHYVEGGAVGGIWEFMADSFRSKWHQGKNLSDMSEIPCAPLSEIVRNQTKKKFFDFLSLDVEGGEFSVIQTMHSLQFGMIIVEADEHDIRKNSMVHTFLSRNGYIRINQDIGVSNEIYINQHFDEIYSSILQ